MRGVQHNYNCPLPGQRGEYFAIFMETTYLLFSLIFVNTAAMETFVVLIFIHQVI